MIENDRTNELQGQYELDDLLPREEGTGLPEGYDADGNLLNVDALPEEGGGRSEEAQTPADAGKLSYAKPEILSSPPQTHDADRLSALATEIKAITEQTRGVVISAALAVGKRLVEARSLCQEGRWLEWLETAVDYSERKAQDMMRLYEVYGRSGSIPDSIAALDYSKAVVLLSAPAEAREALAEQAVDGDMSVRQLQQEIKALKAEKLKAQMRIEGLEQQIDTAQGHIEQLTDEGNRQDQAIVERDEELKAFRRELADAAEKVSVAQAKATAAESAAEQLKRLRAEAEERADQNAQRASDAVKRANQVAKDLAEAKARIQALSEAAAAGAPEPERVEVVPEDVQREIEQLKRELAEARANAQGTGNRDIERPENSPVDCFQRDGAGRPLGTGMAQAATAAEKFKWFYQNQMQPTFKTALTLLQEVAREDGHAADAFATALTNACKVLMNQLGSGE